MSCLRRIVARAKSGSAGCEDKVELVPFGQNIQGISKLFKIISHDQLADDVGARLEQQLSKAISREIILESSRIADRNDKSFNIRHRLTCRCLDLF